MKPTLLCTPYCTGPSKGSETSMVLLPAASKATESMAIIRMQMSEACRKAPMPQARLSICEADLPCFATWYDIISGFRVRYGLRWFTHSFLLKQLTKHRAPSHCRTEILGIELKGIQTKMPDNTKTTVRSWRSSGAFKKPKNDGTISPMIITLEFDEWAPPWMGVRTHLMSWL